MLAQLCAQGQVFGVGKGRACSAGLYQSFGSIFVQAAHQPQAQTHSGLRQWRHAQPPRRSQRLWCALQRAVDVAAGHVDGQHTHAVAARILHQLRGGVKTHGQRIEQRGQKTRGLMAFEPAAGIGQQGKAVGVAFRKAIFAKAQHLLEDGLGKLGTVTTRFHASDQWALEPVHAALALPGRHRPAQIVRHAGREPGRHHGDLHHLLLKNRHAQRARQGRFQFRLFQLQWLAPAPAFTRLQVGVHHAALNRPGPHNRHLHHQVVELARPQARQHAHLRAAFDLEHAHGVGGADHVVGGGVFARNALEVPALTAQGFAQIQAAAQRAEHAQGQHIDLEQAHGVQVVLVPLDDRSVLHARGLHGHQARELALREHKAAHMLAQVARKAFEVRRQLQPQLGRVPVQRCTQAFSQFLQPVGGELLVKPVVVLGKGIDQGRRHAQRLAHIAQCAARAVGGNHGRDGGALAAVFFVDVLDDLLAPVVLEVHVDVGRLLALFADKALEQQV